MIENNKIYIPRFLQIETVNGLCNARCTMCSIRDWGRKPYRMTMKEFQRIIEKFIPYQKNLEFLSLFFCSEPLFDQTISEKISYSKQLGFKGIGLSTNCSFLDEKKSLSLLNAGLDTLICSIDGVTKKIHEAIRIGTYFDEIVANVENFIQLRNDHGFKTRLILRFVSQNINRCEWKDYKKFWFSRLNLGLNDEIIKFEVIEWIRFDTNHSETSKKQANFNTTKCNYPFERLIILSNGNVALCCLDSEGIYNIGNVFKEDPISIWNNEIFQFYRKAMLEGHVNKLNPCAHCGVPTNRKIQTRIK